MTDKWFYFYDIFKAAIKGKGVRDVEWERPDMTTNKERSLVVNQTLFLINNLIISIYSKNEYGIHQSRHKLSKTIWTVV